MSVIVAMLTRCLSARGSARTDGTGLGAVLPDALSGMPDHSGSDLRVFDRLSGSSSSQSSTRNSIRSKVRPAGHSRGATVSHRSPSAQHTTNTGGSRSVMPRNIGYPPTIITSTTMPATSVKKATAAESDISHMLSCSTAATRPARSTPRTALLLPPAGQFQRAASLGIET